MNLLKNAAIFLFIIMILTFILCPFLGGNCGREGFKSNDVVLLNSGVSANEPISKMNTTTDSSKKSVNSQNNVNGYGDNYDHYSGSTSPTLYYGPNGSTAQIINNKDRTYSIVVTDSKGNKNTYTVHSNAIPGVSPSSTKATSQNPDFANSISSLMSKFANTTFTASDGGQAKVFVSKDGQYAIEETHSDGSVIIYTATNNYTYNQANASKTTAATASNDSKSNYSLNQSSSIAGTSVTNNNGQYNSALPPGIPHSQIPPGHEDLYILKSQIVPPVCPACGENNSLNNKNNQKCPPCPACARCPDQSNFECKKVPNYGSTNEYFSMNDNDNFGSSSMGSDYMYMSNMNKDRDGYIRGGANSNSINNSFLPVPVVASFSSFGM